MKWIYSTEAVVTVKAEIEIEAKTKDEALDLGSAVLPLNSAEGVRAGWGGYVTLKSPRGKPEVRCGKLMSVQGVSGGERLRKAKA